MLSTWMHYERKDYQKYSVERKAKKRSQQMKKKKKKKR